METTQTQLGLRPASLKASPLKQHPIIPALPPSPSSSSNATRAIFLDHPYARLSSSQASSPRIVNPSPTRRGSVYPAMSNTVQCGVTSGADCFDDGSSGSEWEYSEGEVTQVLTAGSLVHSIDGKDASTGRGRSRQRGMVTALPSFPLPVHDSGLGIDYGDQPSSPLDGRSASRARQMSPQHLNNNSVRVVHTRSSGGTLGDSLRSNDSDAGSAVVSLSKPYPFSNLRRSEASPRRLPQSPSFQGHHRRNTSESMIADSIINAHVMAMRALESFNSPPGSIKGQSYLHSATTTDFPISKFASLSDTRHVTPFPLSTDQPVHLSAHFVKTPYTFTAKKEFPKPKSRPRQRGMHPGDTEEYARLDSAYGDREEEVKNPHDDCKGKHVLGLVASEGSFDLRSRLERNESAQGLTRSCAGSGRESAEGVVWLSIERRSWESSRGEPSKKLVKVVVLKDFMTSNPESGEKKFSLEKEVDFDDKFFAERLRAGHRDLAGGWFRRTFSARKFGAIQLGQSNTWSGVATQDPGRLVSGLLAVGKGMDHTSDTRSPFTEESLMKLYNKPMTGKARYTWVDWASRVSASNNLPQEKSFTPLATITTIQFLHTPSKLRILLALIIMLILSVAAALLWILLGAADTGYRNDISRQRSDRVGSGMAVGVLVLLLESVGFASWVVFS